jgi:hypothetical protein
MKKISNKKIRVISKIYEIDFSGHIKCRINIHNNKIEIEAVMNGYGDPMNISDINVVEIK